MGLKILAFGEVLWGIINDQSHIGGAPLNPAVIVPNRGNKPSIIKAVGSDSLGYQSTIIIPDIGISTVYLSKVLFPTGTVPVEHQGCYSGVVEQCRYCKID